MPPCPSLHRTAADDDIFRRHIDSATVIVSAGFDRDAVVARVEKAILDQNVFARFRVAAVVVRTVRGDMKFANRHVFAQHRMHFPHRRIDDFDAFDQDIFAFVRLDKLRSQITVFAENSFRDRHIARPSSRKVWRGRAFAKSLSDRRRIADFRAISKRRICLARRAFLRR